MVEKYVSFPDHSDFVRCFEWIFTRCPDPNRLAGFTGDIALENLAGNSHPNIRGSNGKNHGTNLP